MRAGAAISIVAPVSLPSSLMLAEPGPRSASAESAKIVRTIALPWSVSTLYAAVYSAALARGTVRP